MKNVRPILRRTPQDPLPYALGLSVSDIRAQEQSFEEKLFHLDSKTYIQVIVPLENF